MDLHRLIQEIGADLSGVALEQLAKQWRPGWVEKGTILARQGEKDVREFMILDGRAVSQISDYEGRDICVGLHTGPGLITPHIARTRKGTALVSLEVTVDSVIAEMDTNVLMRLMREQSEIRDWANHILREELARKTDREWCLAALNGSERLDWFRDRYPKHESMFSHGWIASFLGMTPVSLSRLRRRK